VSSEYPVPVARRDILAVARGQVLECGDRLTEAQIMEVLRIPDDRIGELLALAHEVRLKWCGPEVEVEGIVSLKTGGCPEDCHFCSQSGRFSSPVRSVWRPGTRCGPSVVQVTPDRWTARCAEHGATTVSTWGGG
jgi:hypothetical protein